MQKIAVTMATLESHNHIVGDIERGEKVYKSGGIQFEEWESNWYLCRVPHKNEHKTVRVSFSRDGQDVADFYCDCTMRYGKTAPVCRHVVAAVLAIQGGVTDSGLKLGLSATASSVVSSDNTAKAVGSGDMDVYVTPMMIALMERAACNCLAEVLKPGESSVGTQVSVSHTAASPIGRTVTATATIEWVFDRRIEFRVSASDGKNEVGSGTHTRMIVDRERFLARLE